jgi:hypothetical protein
MNLGGPVWHASISSQATVKIPQLLEVEALRQLAGVGDAAFGEWREFTGFAFHLRRRLSGREQRFVGPVVDIRCTVEARARAARVPEAWLRHAPPEVLAEELGRR